MTAAEIVFIGGIMLNVLTFWFLMINIRALRRLQHKLMDGLVQLERLRKIEQSRAIEQDNRAPELPS